MAANIRKIVSAKNIKLYYQLHSTNMVSSDIEVQHNSGRYKSILGYGIALYTPNAATVTSYDTILSVFELMLPESDAVTSHVGSLAWVDSSTKIVNVDTIADHNSVWQYCTFQGSNTFVRITLKDKSKVISLKQTIAFVIVKE